MTESLSCSLKAQQKVFLLNQLKANSCCRSQATDLHLSTSVATLVQNWQQEKDLLSQGVQVESCEVCWQDEKNNISSYRQLQGQTVRPNEIQLSLSNACNHMCSYCSPKYSSTWQKNISDQGNFIKISESAKKNLELLPKQTLDQDFWLHQIQQNIQSESDNSVDLTLLGGEPLMQIDSLKQMLALNNSKISKLNVITSLAPPNNKFLLWILKNISRHKLYFYISLDSAPDANHIPRAGFNATAFKENLDLLISHQVNFEFQAVFSVLNFFALPEYCQWLDSIQGKWTLHRLYNPDCLDPGWIPDQFVMSTRQKLQHYSVPDFVNQSHDRNTLVDLKLKEQYNYLTQYFERTGTDVNTKNSEFNQYWAWLEERFQ